MPPHSRLVEADSVCENLKGWFGGHIHAAGHTELGTDVVGTGGGRISQESGLGEVPALLGKILGECGGIEIGLGNGDVEDASAGGDGDGDSHIHA